MSAPESPLALLGYPPQASRTLRQSGVLAIHVPTDDLVAVMAACRTLKFSGALVHPSLEQQAFAAVTPDSTARRVGRVDCVAFTAEAHGTYALADALTDTLEASGYALRGASAVLIGHQPQDLALAAPLTRLGFTDVGVVAETSPDAERAARDLPAGLRRFPMSRRDPALLNLTERADLVILTAGSLPAGVLQPYHTLVDLTGTVTDTKAATLLDLSGLSARRLARQLAHATGQRFHVEELQALLPTLY